MRALIWSGESCARWTRRVLEVAHPLCLTVAAKPIIEYYLDFCRVCGVSAVRVVSDLPLAEVRAATGSGTRWGVPIDFALCFPTDTLQDLLRKNSGFRGSDTVLVLHGLPFVWYSQGDALEGDEFFAESSAGGTMRCDSGGLACVRPGLDPSVTLESLPARQAARFSLRSMATVAEWFDRNMEVVGAEPERFALPGFRQGTNVWVGHATIIRDAGLVEGPAIVGSRTLLDRRVVVGPRAVIGSSVIVDEATEIVDGIVCDGTYVGANLEVKGRIALRDRLVDPRSGEFVPIDNHLLSGTGGGQGLPLLVRHVWHAAAAAAIYALLLLPRALLLCALWLLGARLGGGTTYICEGGRAVRLRPIESRPGASPWMVRLVGALALGAVGALPQVVAGRLWLVGNTPLADTVANRAAIAGMTAYRPGVFTYATAFARGTDATGARLHELYYATRTDVLTDLRALARGFFRGLRRPW